ncbi:hypothetical protein MNBD_GAMMA10-370 [hydrothermal vent metagenome]|uniref:Uncharacterized protein n=1 Tax=hydrothermal vent metagenome TaxID=652676 RepID=A0A3B0YDP9_9ZZZZ
MKEKYGTLLSEQVYAYLMNKGNIAYNHYGYCGTGFVFFEGSILYTHIDEWLLYESGVDYEKGGKYVGIIKAFKTSKAFISWLSEQTDETLSGKETADSWYINNQRITKNRLKNLK